MKDNRTERINIRCTKAEKEGIKAAAEEMGMVSMSEYMVLSALTLGFKDRKAQALLKEARAFLIRLIDSDRAKVMDIQELPDMPGLTKEDKGEMISELRAEMGRCDWLIDQIDDYITI